MSFEIIDNTFQVIVLAAMALLAFLLAFRRSSRSCLILAFGYASFMMGTLYYLLHLIILGHGPQVFYVAECSWMASYFFFLSLEILYWEGLMLHFATIAPDLGLYMGRHLDKNGAYYAKGIQHPDKEMELLEEIRRCMDPDEKHKLEKELQAAIYDAEDGSCLFGRVLYVNKSSMYKYDYVIDDHATEAFTACWDLSACWLNK